MKKALSLTLSLLMLLSMALFPVSAATSDGAEVAPCFNNTISIHTDFDITEKGVATAYVSYNGYQNVATGGTITIKLQKRTFGIFWTDLTIGGDDNTLVIEASGHSYSTTQTWNLPSSGTYRVVITVTVYGTGGEADYIETTMKDSY